MRTLILLYRATGERRFLEPVPRALAYLNSSALPDGRLARFYELKTNRPLYFTRDYQLTYDDSDLPTHYGFKMPNDLAEIDKLYRQAVAGSADLRQTGHHPEDFSRSSSISASRMSRLRKDALAVVSSLDSRGAWISPRGMKGFRKASPQGVIESQVFIDNVYTLCEYLKSLDE